MDSVTKELNDFLVVYENKKNGGCTEREIADHFGISVLALRTKKRIAKYAVKSYQNFIDKERVRAKKRYLNSQN